MRMRMLFSITLGLVCTTSPAQVLRDWAYLSVNAPLTNSTPPASHQSGTGGSVDFQAGFMAQAPFYDGMWKDPFNRGPQFANRYQWMHGGTIAAGAVATAEARAPRGVLGTVTQTTTIGLHSEALSTADAGEGSTITWGNRVGLVGLQRRSFPFFAVGAPPEEDNQEPGDSDLLDFRPRGDLRWPALPGESKESRSLRLRSRQTLSSQNGVENVAWLSRPLVEPGTAPLMGSRNSPAVGYDGNSLQGMPDVRMTTYQERQDWQNSPAVVRQLISAWGLAHARGTTAFANPLVVREVLGGQAFLETSSTVNGTAENGLIGVFSGVQNFGSSLGIEESAKNGLQRTSPLFPSGTAPPGTVSRYHDESLGFGVVDDYVGIHVPEPEHGGLQVGVRIGVLVEDMDPGSGGGAPPQVAAIVRGDLQDGASLPVPSNPVFPVEKVSGLMTRGSVHFGNQSPNTAAPPDVVYIKDLLHLVPQAQPPIPENQAFSPRHVGVIYFDAETNGLKISLPILVNGQPAITWAKIKMKVPQTGLATNAWAALRSRLTLTKESPNLEFGYSLPRASSVRLFWKRRGYGPERLGETKWIEVPAGSVSFNTSNKTGQAAVSFATLGTTVGVDGMKTFDPEKYRFLRFVVQAMVIDPTTDECAGASTVIEQSEIATPTSTPTPTPTSTPTPTFP